MLARIDLRYFKCFTLLKLPLRPLTLLSGTNASGKSSVIQALALLHQTMREHEWSSHFVLNGSAVHLGTTADVIDQVQGHRAFGISLQQADGSYVQWEAEGERDDMAMGVKRVSAEFGAGRFDADGSKPLRYLLPHDALSSAKAMWLADCVRQLTYLTAERLGPRETYPLGDPRHAPVVGPQGATPLNGGVSGKEDPPVVGPQGQHTASVLYHGDETRVLKKLVAVGEASTLRHQVEARMQGFFPGCEFVVEKVSKANAVTLGIRTSRSMDFHRPVHTGFGLTQVLPIVVAALSAEEDSLLMIENPEVHLHPAGQSHMGEFLAEVAAAGVQVILETHSDHVLNGIRRAVKRNALSPDDAALHFFRPRDEKDEDAAQVHSPALDRDGNIDSWPDGFFDQFDKDMNHFAGWS